MKPLPDRVTAAIDHRDALLALVLLAVCGVLLVLTFGFDEPDPLLSQGVPPASFPRTLLGILAVLALILPFERRLRRPYDPGADETRREPVPASTRIALLLLTAAALLWTLAGMVAALVLVAVAMPMVIGERRLPTVLAYATILVASVLLLFVGLLDVSIDGGLLHTDRWLR